MAGQRYGNEISVMNVYASYVEVSRELDAENRLAFYDAIFDFLFLGKEPDELPTFAKIAFISVRHQLEKERSDKLNGKKGGKLRAKNAAAKDAASQDECTASEKSPQGVEKNHEPPAKSEKNISRGVEKKIEPPDESEKTVPKGVNESSPTYEHDNDNDNDNDNENENAHENAHESLAREPDAPEISDKNPPGDEPDLLYMLSDPQKGYAQTVFDILHENSLPCANGNVITFTQREFYSALHEIHAMRIHSDNVIQAVRNYASVIAMSRRGESWWTSEQDFYSFVKNKTIMKFLPGNFSVQKFAAKKSEDIPKSLDGKAMLEAY